MKKIKLFTDSSVNPQEKIGFGAYLFVEDENKSLDELKKNINIKKFEDTSSTKLELQTLLWAFEHIIDKNIVIEVYTDCQNIIGLEDRKEKLKNKHFLNNKLYEEFFVKLDQLHLTFIKVKGHKKNNLKDEIDNIFNLVDKASRSALRKNMLI